MNTAATTARIDEQNPALNGFDKEEVKRVLAQVKANNAQIDGLYGKLGRALMRGDNEAADGLMADIKTLMKLTKNPDMKSVDVLKNMSNFITELDKPMPPHLHTGLGKLDDILWIPKGKGYFMVVGAEPSAGKTAFAMQIAQSLTQDTGVGYYSFEMDAEILEERLYAMVTNTELARIQRHNLTQTEKDEMVSCFYGRMSGRRLDLNEAAGRTVAEITRHAEGNGYGAIVVDHLGLVQTKEGESRTVEITKITNELYEWAQRTKTFVLALSQLPKTGYGKGNKTTGGLKDAATITEDADIVLYLDRDLLARNEEERMFTEIIIGKNRNGKGVGTRMAAKFDGAHQRFCVLTRDELEYMQKGN